MDGRRIALVCMTPEPDTDELGGTLMPSYGVRRVMAALVADPALAGAAVGLVDLARPDFDGYLDRLLRVQPQIVGFSVYVWSLPFLVEVARELKRRRPQCMVVFGGPSARPAMLDLPPYAPAQAYLDAVVTTEGEAVMRAIAALPVLDRASLRGVAGLHLPANGLWLQTAPRPPASDLDGIASPFQLGLMPPGSVAYLETYRGCPLSCRFCQWGASEAARAVFSVDYLVRELQALRALRPTSVFLLDAGLNLSAKAFAHLAEAERQVGALREIQFWAEIYPTLVKDEHLAFLAQVGTSYLGVGLQSLDAQVLELHDRPFKRERFEAALKRLIPVATAELQIIFGLPGDTPAGFCRTLDYARSFGIAVRAYHCLVLPDALLSRGRPDWQMRFDPLTMAMRSCLGWREDDIANTRSMLDAAAAAAGGRSGRYWWSFPRRGATPP